MFNSGIHGLPHLDMVVGVKRIHRGIPRQRVAAMDNTSPFSASIKAFRILYVQLY